MLSSYDKKQVNTQAKKDLVKKLRLERIFLPEVKSLFARMIKDFRINVAATGTAPPANGYSSSWQDALKKHYARVQKAFSGSVIQFNSKSIIAFEIKQEDDEEDEGNIEELFLLALLLFRNDRALKQEGFITNTNNKNMSDAIIQARQSLEEQEEPTDNRSIAAAASAILSRKFKGRAENIVTLETQAPAESTKLFEARSLSGMAPSPDVQPIEQIIRPAIPDTIKTWRTVGDRRVRPSHVRANFQKVPISEPFIVKGQQLMYPGDTSLGATVDNVAQCRCSATYSGIEAAKPIKPKPEPKPKPKPVKPIKPVKPVKPKPTKPKVEIKPPDKNLSKEPKSKPVLEGGQPPTKKPYNASKPDTDAFKKTGRFTADEKTYTEWYSGDGFKEMNDYLRNPNIYANDPSKVKSLNIFKNNLSSAISKSEVTENIKVYRGINSKSFKDIANSGKLKELAVTGFQSTSLSQRAAANYSGLDGTVMRINVPKGTKALNMNKLGLSKNASEAEILLDDGGKYIVKNISQGFETAPGIRRTIVDVDYIPK